MSAVETPAAVQTACRSCGHDKLETVLSLGSTPLANSLLTAADLERPEPSYPLTLAYCRECHLVQLLETVTPERLFREYSYYSSFSDTMLDHARDLAAALTSRRSLGAGSLVVELASNDGYLLKNFVREGIPVLGIDPAANVAATAESAGVPTLVEFFDNGTAQALRGEGQAADVILALNVLGHVADLHGFVSGMATLLKDDGIAVVETPSLCELVARNEFDTIYHEHLHYFSLHSLQRLFLAHDLTIVDAEKISIHGGSLRIHLQHRGAGPASPAVTQILREETDAGITSRSFYSGFAIRTEALRTALRELLSGLRNSGARIAAYGAAAKGVTLLSYCGIGPELIEFVADRSTYKQSHFMPGAHLPILPPQALKERKPDYVLLLTWNFADEIMAQQRDYLEQGGHFIIPVPEPVVVTAGD
jgi:2-polyprenyl-3-methyl-5-hydroxy-6-metoxy-1,4-benzoquinol methylase